MYEQVPWYFRSSPSLMQLIQVLDVGLQAQPDSSETAPLFLCSEKGTWKRRRLASKRGNFFH